MVIIPAWERLFRSFALNPLGPDIENTCDTFRFEFFENLFNICSTN